MLDRRIPRRPGHQVSYITHFDNLGPYLRHTLEEQRMYQRLVELGVHIYSQQIMLAFEPGRVGLVHLWGGQESTLDCDSLALVTHRYSDCAIYDELLEDPQRREAAGISQLHLIGDAHTPGIIAQAVFSGHRLAREIDSPNPDEPLPFIRERLWAPPRRISPSAPRPCSPQADSAHPRFLTHTWPEAVPTRCARRRRLSVWIW